MGEYEAYTAYLLVGEVALLILCLAAWFRQRRQQGGASVRGERAISKRKRARAAAAPQAVKGLKRRNVPGNVPIPWGWPGYQEFRAQRMEKPSLSQSMSALIDSLVAEKQLAAAPSSYNARFINSMRMVLEDKHGLSEASREIEYEPVTHPPLLQNPDERHDQMANFGRAGKIRARGNLRYVGATKVLQDGTTEVQYMLSTGVDGIKRPWGW